MKPTPLPHLRALLGLSQHQAAALLGISQSLYQFYETGRRSIPIARYAQLSSLANAKKSTKTKPIASNRVVLSCGTRAQSSGKRKAPAAKSVPSSIKRARR